VAEAESGADPDAAVSASMLIVAKGEDALGAV